MAYPIQNVDGGDCPDTHPVQLVSLFYEFGLSQPSLLPTKACVSGRALTLADVRTRDSSVLDGAVPLPRTGDVCLVSLPPLPLGLSA